MKDMKKTKAQLVEELEGLREQLVAAGSGVVPPRSPDRRLLYSLVDQMLEPTVILDFEGMLLHGNDLAGQVLGLDSGDGIAGMSLAAIMHPDELEQAAIDLEMVKNKEADFSSSYRLLVDGRTIRIESHGTKIELSDGAVDLVSFRDVTGRREKEEKDRANDLILKNVLDHTSTVVFVKDVEGKYLLINRRYEELFGVTNEEIVGKTDFDVFPAEAARQFQEKDRKAIEAHGPIEEEEIVPHEDGAHTYLSVKFPMYSLDGEAFATCGISTDITERKRAEEALASHHDELEERVEERTRELTQLNSRLIDEVTERIRAQEQATIFQKFAQASGQGFGMADLQGETTYLNPAACRMLGFDKCEEGIGKPIAAFHPEIERERLAREVIPAVLEQGEWTGEVPVINTDGVEVPTILSMFLLRDEQGEPQRFAAVLTDISERKIAEEALLESERKFRALADTTTATIIMAGEDGIFYANKAAEVTTGYSLEELSKLDVMTELFDFENWEEHWKEEFERAARNRESLRGMELKIRTKDGKTRWLESSGSFIEIGGQLVDLSTSFDITERKEAEAALERSEQMFRALTESMQAMVVIASLEEERAIYANPKTTELTGYSLEEMTAHPPPQLFSEESLKEATRLRKAYMEGEPLPDWMEVEIVTKGGEKRWLESAVALVEIGDAGVHKVVTSFDITERKRAEEALRESEKRFRALADSTTASIAIVAGEGGRFAYANQTMLDKAGVTWEELSTFDPVDSLTPAAYEAGGIAEEAAKARGDDQYRFEYEDENGRWSEVNVALTELDGEQAQIFTAFDITEHKLAQHAMEESEKKFRALAESTTAQIAIARVDRFLYANKATLDHYGLTWEELATRTPREMFIQDDEEEADCTAMFAEALAQGDGDSFRWEFSETNDEGVEQWFQISGSEIEIDGEQAWIWTTFDVTEHKLAQATLAENEKRYRTIFDTAGTGMISFGDNTMITMANEEWIELSGYSREETVGKLSWTHFFTEQSLIKMKKYHAQRIEDPDSVPAAYESQFVDRNGTVHDGIVNIQLIPGTHMRVASFQDMTQLKRAQHEMYRADKMAALGQIIAGVAHEINNPNNFIYFNLPILRKYVEAIAPLLELRLEEDPELKILNMPYAVFLEDVFKLLENMEHGSKRITSIVSELKNYVRSDEEQDLKSEQVSEVVDHVMALVGKQVNKMVKRFDVEIDDGLLPVKMNAGKIEQALINLVINAGQATDKDDSRVVLSARSDETDKGFVVLQVEDNGSGIPEAKLGQIFEPFYTSKLGEGGTGLGLAISQRIIEEHGGTIGVKSVLGEGTVFTIRLPVVK